MKIDLSQLVTRADKEAAAEAAGRASARSAAAAELAATDWMVVREAETGAVIPDQVRAARAAARALLSDTPVTRGLRRGRSRGKA